MLSCFVFSLNVRGLINLHVDTGGEVISFEKHENKYSLFSWGMSFLNSSLRLTPENEELVNCVSHYDFANMSFLVLESGADELVPNSQVPALNL